jgi:hypothetical protein
MLLVNTTTPGIVNWEGQSLALLALAPVSSAGIILSKWIVALLPPLAMVELALAGLAVYLRLPVGEAVPLAVTLAFLIAALAGTTLTVNVTWPRLDATNPRRPSSATAAIIGLATDGALSAATGILLFLSLYIWHGAQTEEGIAGLLVALTAIILANLQLGRSGLRRLMHGGSLVQSAS